MENKLDQKYMDNIANSLKKCGLNQATIAEKLNLSPSTVNSLAQAKRDPKLGTLIAIADLIGMSLDEMTGYSVSLQPSQADEQYALHTVNRMEASLIHLYCSLSEIANFKQNETTTEIVTYVQECIQQIMNGQRLKGEIERPEKNK